MVLLIPAVLILSAFVVLYIPSVQDMIVRKAAGYASEVTGMGIEIERLRLSFPLNLSAHNVSAVAPGNDTLLHLQRLTLQVRFKPLLKGILSAGGIRLEKLDFNTGNLLDGVVVKGRAGDVFLRADSVSPANERALLNQVVLSDAEIDLFVCDTTAADTSTLETNWLITVEQTELHRVAFSCRLPCDSVSLDLQIDNALLTDAVADLGGYFYGASHLQLDVPAFFYDTDLRETLPAGFDASHIHLYDVHLWLDSLSYTYEKDLYAQLKAGSACERSGIV
ncbi:MAG: AsmA family protein, partial [Tannerella sp.]|nr:AsmA family protein [Tannerella sp.]